jgi:hypothetical protein
LLVCNVLAARPACAKQTPTEVAKAFRILLTGSAPYYAISDSLVRNLSCKNLTEANVLKSLQPDAFDRSRELPIRNWDSNGIANCWGLALAQRDVFYFMRFGVSNLPSLEQRNYTEDVARMISGDDAWRKIYRVPYGQSSLGSGYNAGGGGGAALLAELNSLDDGNDFTRRIETREKNRFFNPANLIYVAGGGALPVSTNRSNIKLIISDLRQGRLPLLNLRAAVTAQHIVIVRRVESQGDGNYDLHIYDPNAPGSDSVMQFSDGEFHFSGLGQEDDVVGVFVVDEGDMNNIQRKMYDYYAEICQKLH